jgi:tetratricopeptide (TPR) repeat protein
MLKDSSTKRKKKLSLENIQQYLTYFLLFTLPVFIMPFPWDWTEKGMSLLILVVATLVIGIEVVKLIWKGKTSILKSVLDIGLLIVAFSMLISTLFSVDFYTSLWGIDGRMGSSLTVFLVILLFSYTSRNYINTWDHIKKSLYAFLIGFGINNLLSALSFFDINIWGFIPVLKDLHQGGLPLFRSSKLHLFINFINLLILIGLYLSTFFTEKKEKLENVIQIILLIFSAVNIVFFSINQGFSLVVMFVIFVGLFVWLLLRKLKLSDKENKSIFVSIALSLIAILIPVALLQIPKLREIIIPPNLELVTQLTLGTDVSWVVSASVFVDSIWRGLVGMGVDTFSIAYNMFKPLNQNLLNLNDVNFYYAGNELFTKFANGGLIWLVAWIFLGFLLYKLVKRDYSELKSYKNNSLGVVLITLDSIILFIYLASIFATYSVLVLVIFFLVIAFSTILRNILRKDNTDKFVIKLWTMDLTPDSGDTDGSNFNIFLTAITVIVVSILTVFWMLKGVSSMYMLKAESYYNEQNTVYSGDVYPTIEQRDEFITQMSKYYTLAVKFDKSNPLANRKDGLMSLEKVGIAAEKYSQAQEGDDTEALLKDVGLWKNYAIDSTRKSIDTSVNVYDNWEARVRTYMGLIGLGFSDYTADAIYSLEKASDLKPTNYNLYYSKAQIYVINGEQDNALAALTQVFGINPQHVSSLMLAAEINKSKGNTDVYESYLKAAKKVLETAGETSTESYQTVVKLLNELGTTLENTEESSDTQVEDAQTSVSE